MPHRTKCMQALNGFAYTPRFVCHPEMPLFAGRTPFTLSRKLYVNLNLCVCMCVEDRLMKPSALSNSSMLCSVFQRVVNAFQSPLSQLLLFRLHACRSDYVQSWSVSVCM